MEARLLRRNFSLAVRGVVVSRQEIKGVHSVARGEARRHHRETEEESARQLRGSAERERRQRKEIAHRDSAQRHRDSAQREHRYSGEREIRRCIAYIEGEKARERKRWRGETWNQ